ncbi:hypothetical protein QBC46DRAFT_410431 [Diplogelasinospora grovesii]|uniref:Uncharacterized protein n=1 Tax=Diplogelasinospora grovesii TaxID=303347 RepID=A0AAN6N2U3_9PEZI|nr:hypothetical protein QBC46DRAFT_410431 [Diplogelasinospora grovesii]
MHQNQKFAGLADSDPLWACAVREVVKKLPEHRAERLLQKGNQEPLTTSQLLDQVTASYSKNSNKILQKFFSKIDPILSHIASFQSAVNVVVQNELMVTATIWAAFHMLIQVWGALVIERHGYVPNLPAKSNQKLLGFFPG